MDDGNNALHFQISTDCGDRALSMMLLVMMMVMIFTTLSFLFDWIEITNCRANSIKVDFNDGVVITSPFQRSNLKPSFFLMVVLENLKTRNISHDQLKNSEQYLISAVTPIPTTNQNHLLV